MEAGLGSGLPSKRREGGKRDKKGGDNSTDDVVAMNRAGSGKLKERLTLHKLKQHSDARVRGERGLPGFAPALGSDIPMMSEARRDRDRKFSEMKRVQEQEEIELAIARYLPYFSSLIC